LLAARTTTAELILESLKVEVEDFETGSGWKLDQRGACWGEVCIPLASDTSTNGLVDVALLARQLDMPIIHDEKHEIWSLGPRSGGRALVSAVAPDLILPEIEGKSFELSSLRGQKVLLVAWASW
jgi:hypothetical protein